MEWVWGDGRWGGTGKRGGRKRVGEDIKARQ